MGGTSLGSTTVWELPFSSDTFRPGSNSPRPYLYCFSLYSPVSGSRSMTVWTVSSGPFGSVVKVCPPSKERRT